MREMEKSRGTRLGGCIVQPPDDTPTYADLGIEKTAAHRWQKMAEVPDADFERHIAETKDACEELTTASVLRLADRLRRDPDDTPEMLSLDDAVEQLMRVARRLFATWPEAYREVMGHQLIAIGKEILENGDIRP